MKYPIIASDMDGTLLAPDHTLTPYAKQTLQQLTQQDLHFVFATGRHHIDIAQIRDNLAMSSIMITSNGARIHDSQGNLLFSHNVDSHIARSLYTLVANDDDILTHIYLNDEWFLNRPAQELTEFFQESVFDYQLCDLTRLPTNGVCKVFYTSDNIDKLNQLERQINHQWPGQVNVSFSLPTCLEVMAGGVSKGHALQEVVKNLGYTLTDCIAFGDGMNDKEMLAMVGKGCLMANADPRLKALLPQLEVIGSNRDDAVIHYLAKLYL